MSDDELIGRLRQTLHAEASSVTAPEDEAWERFEEAAAASAPVLLHGTRRGLRFAVPVGVVGLAAAVLVAVLVTRGSTVRSTQLASDSTTTAAAAVAAVPAAGASAATAATAPTQARTAHPGPSPTTALSAAAGATPSTGFAPESATFVSPDEGWALGLASCAGSPCAALRHTTDGGGSWAPQAAPPSTQVTHLRFADQADGWAWGGSELWVTHDGGASWGRAPIPAFLGIEDLEASAGVVHVALLRAEATVQIASSPVGSDAWAFPTVGVGVGAGPVPQGQFVLQGTVGWFVQVDRTVVGGARLSGGTWQSWTPPCSADNGPAVLAASSSSDLVAVCDAGVWGSAGGTSPGEHVYVSGDGGATSTEPGPMPLSNVSGVAAAPGVIAVSGSDGAGKPVLEATFDGGRSWSRVYEGANATTVVELGFTTPHQGVAVLVGPGQTGSVLMTRDGGHTWAEVAFP